MQYFQNFGKPIKKAIIYIQMKPKETNIKTLPKHGLLWLISQVESVILYPGQQEQVCPPSSFVQLELGPQTWLWPQTSEQGRENNNTVYATLPGDVHKNEAT